MTPDQPEVAIARIEATLEAIKKQIDHQDRNTGQLVKLFEERITARFNSVDRRLDSMDQSREIARQDSVRERQEINKKFDQIDGRLALVERFNAKVVGAAAVAAMFSSAATAALMKAIGA